LYESWIQEGSQFQINIDSELRASFGRAIEENDMDTLIGTIERCEIEMVHIMAEPFKRFLDLVLLEQKVRLARKMALWWMQPKLPTCSEFFSFPDPINLADSRCSYLVAMCFLLLSMALDFFLDFPWMYCYVTWNYYARFFCGPRLSPDTWISLPISTLATKYGLLQHHYIPSPPRRFAQLLGCCCSSLVLILRLTGFQIAALALCGLLALLAFAGGALNLCLGCVAFNLLIKIGVIPRTVCEACTRNYENLAQECTPKAVTLMLSELGLLHGASSGSSEIEFSSGISETSASGEITVEEGTPHSFTREVLTVV